MSALLLALLGPALQGSEADYYAVDYLTPPAGEVIEVGGMDFLPDGRLAVSTRRGQVWLVENPLAKDPAEARFQLFAEGLNEGLGLIVVGGAIHVVQRGELSRLIDEDADGVCDRIDTLCDSWGLSGNYHEFAYGLPVDRDGNFYVSLNVSFFSPKWWHGKSTVPWRGWVVRISPEGELTPFASGFRSPCGIGTNAAGELFVTDNQGDWMPASPLFHVQEESFYGHPASLAWTKEYLEAGVEPSDTIPPAAANRRAPAAVWLPYKWARSPGNLVAGPADGRFGPFGEQLFVAELTNGMVLRVMLERVRGEYQGAAVPFRQKIGSACRVCFAPDATLFVGMTNRGWGGQPPASGIARVRWTGALPMEIENVTLTPLGFDVRFTRPLGAKPTAETARITKYDYDYWWEYGSPERALEEVELSGFGLSADRRTLTLRIPGLEAGKVARVELFNVAADDGTPLLHNEFAYTINHLRESAAGEAEDPHVAKIVPPPPARESGEEGWLRLTYGDATDRWSFEGWEMVDAELDPADPTKLSVQPGVNALTNTASDAPSNYYSKAVFGDGSYHVEFMLPQGGNSGVLMMGRYEIDLRDSEPDRELTPEHCGGIPGGAGFDGVAPRFHPYAGEGRWHDLDIDFQAPRFDASGRKTANARLLRVRIDDTLLHENVELPGPTRGLEGPEAAEGPLVLQGNATEVAFGNIRVRPRRSGEEERDGWTYLLGDDDSELAGWKTSGAAVWTLEDGVLIGQGAAGHLFSPRADYRNFELEARVKISDGGNSGLYARAAFGDGWPQGYEAQINSSYADPQKTGSLYNLSPVRTQLVAPDTWFDYHVSVKDEDAGTRIVIRVNGVVVAEHVDAERRYASGHVAIQQHHEGSVVELKELRVRELP